MSSLLWWVSCLAVILVAMPYLLGPIVVWLTIRHDQNALREVKLEDLAVQPRQAFDRYRALAADLGFEHAAIISSAQGFAATCYSFVAIDAQRRVLLQIMVLPRNAEWAEVREVIQLQSYDRERAVFVTSNSPDPSSFPRHPDVVEVAVPGETDAHRLLKVHVGEMQRRGFVPSTVAADAVARSVLQDNARSFANAEKAGALYRAGGEGMLRPTVFGAIRMTWFQLWPIAAVVRGRMRRQGEQALAAWCPPST